MDFEQRLDALAHTVEVLGQFQASHEANISRLYDLHAEMQAKFESNFDRLFRLQARNEEMMGQLVESVTSLARIAQAHERRISDLEDRQ